MKTPKEFLALPYTKTVRWSADDGVFVARVNEIEGCTGHGDSEADALKMLRDNLEEWIGLCLAAGDAVPTPATETLPSGKWLQRVPRTLHKKLADLAHREGVSLNQYVVSVLAEAVGAQSSASSAANIVSIDAATSFNAGYICQYGGGLSPMSESRIDANLWYELQGVVAPELANNPRTTVIQLRGGRSNAKKEGQEFAYNN
jgi:predicted HicB family RNase H-like nuclease